MLYYVEVPVLSTYKLETRVKEGASSEPESGYKTDNSATYSQVEEKVADIQRKVRQHPETVLFSP